LFLKDTQLKKTQINPLFSLEPSKDTFHSSNEDSSNDIVSSNEGYRRVRHSAAMIGLALSMGATGILIPNGDQKALANEPNLDSLSFTSPSHQEENVKEIIKEQNKLETETVAFAPEYSSLTKDSLNKQEVTPSNKGIESQTVQVTSPPEVLQIASPNLQHEVKDGDTLWQLSQEYKVAPEAIALSNEISPQGTIIAGETLDIPVGDGIVYQAQGTETIETLSQSYGVTTENIKPSQTIQLNQPLPQGESVTISGNVDTLLRQQQQSALNRLQEEKNELQKELNNSPSELKNSPDEIAIISPQPLEVKVIDQTQNQLTDNLNNGSLIQGADSNFNQTDNQTALNIPSSQSQDTTATEKPSTIIPQTALLPSTNNPIDFHNFTEPIAIPVPLPGLQEQKLPQTQNQAPSRNTNLAAELPQIPIAVEQTIAFAPASPQVYTVRRGDTLDSIARNYGISISELMEQNNLSNPHLIKTNQQLTVPEQQAQPESLNLNPVAQTVTLPQVTALNSNQSLPNIPAVTEAENATDNAVGRMTADLNRLREQGQSSTLSKTDDTVAFNPVSSFNQPIEIPVEPYRAVNPEWQNRNVTPSEPSVQPTQPRVNTATSVQQNQPEQLIAAAPIAANSYNPMLQLPVGTTVSPTLPGLQGPDQYLPSNPGRFEGYIWPAKGVLTSGYGPRWGRMHRGIDIAGPIGTPIMAAAPGEVIFAGWNSGGYGNLVKIKHDDGSVTLYAHNNRISVRNGQYVDQGQQIAEMGSTGFSTGPHLHFEVHPSGRGAINPMALLPRR
jgi:murein DD-endopeptidase MepM/ murein hydrolase activator NlpD